MSGSVVAAISATKAELGTNAAIEKQTLLTARAISKGLGA